MWIKQFQQEEYQFDPVPVIHQYFEQKMCMYDEEFLWKLSLQVEPREQT